MSDPATTCVIDGITLPMPRSIFYQIAMIMTRPHRAQPALISSGSSELEEDTSCLSGHVNIFTEECVVSMSSI